jgi:hypothetical protein
MANGLGQAVHSQLLKPALHKVKVARAIGWLDLHLGERVLDAAAANH